MIPYDIRLAALRRRQALTDQQLRKLKTEWDAIEGEIATVYLEMRDEAAAPAEGSKP